MTEKILIVGPAWVGDMVMAHSLFQVLASERDNPVIDVLAPAWTLPLLERFPEVRRGIELPFGHGALDLKNRWRLGKSLRSENYDQAIVLPRSLKSAIIPFAARAKRRTGYLGEMRYGLLNDIRSLDKQKLPRTVDRFVNLGRDSAATTSKDFPLPLLATPPADELREVMGRLGLGGEQGRVLGLCPGAEYGPAKQWPAAHFAEVARRWNAGGHPVWIFGSSKDEAAAEEIQRLSGGATVNLCGKTSLLEVIDLMSACSAVITNDSGLMHVAAATGTHVIAIYGGSDPEHTPPLSKGADILFSKLECWPCMKRTCRFGHYNCLKNVTPDSVLEHISS
ncbi:MAG: lipopolysaccharide heptosyltransferase II [Acidiferrobacterales bacterium]